MADIFDVVADPTRRELLRILLERSLEGADAPHGGESSVGELVLRLGLSQPTVSKHLKVLRDCALVTVRDQGQHRFYRLDPRPLDDIASWVVPFLPSEPAALEPDARSGPAQASERPAPLLGTASQGLGERVGRGLATALHAVRGVGPSLGRAGGLGRR
ncbi:MAG: ArsR family transcriptional regulator [Naasia sp.]|jgi:ArsR family transcriptional regulator|uniref:ArsR/SmtB family transcription factor n=1 Tax=Naasia sp. TaxID=2546198 RepID=UPI0026177ECB|nr:metalloregulator ArsR/SmtB family transcription factor [Naasia sp.]MCU1570639.1 ArsR family transcriptional regulator [Naasia sp.]